MYVPVLEVEVLRDGLDHHLRRREVALPQVALVGERDHARPDGVHLRTHNAHRKPHTAHHTNKRATSRLYTQGHADGKKAREGGTEAKGVKCKLEMTRPARVGTRSEVFEALFRQVRGVKTPRWLGRGLRTSYKHVGVGILPVSSHISCTASAIGTGWGVLAASLVIELRRHMVFQHRAGFRVLKVLGHTCPRRRAFWEDFMFRASLVSNTHIRVEVLTNR